MSETSSDATSEMSSTVGSPTKRQDASSPETDTKTKDNIAGGDKTEEDNPTNTDKDVEGDDKGEKKEESEKE